jgi:hypothetical protein
MVTCVPCGQAFIHHASLISDPLRPLLPSSSRLLNVSLHLHERMLPPFRSYPIKHHKMRRFVHESMHAEVNHA